MATTWNRLARAGIWARQEYQKSGKPWISTTNGSSFFPRLTQWIFTPPESMNPSSAPGIRSAAFGAGSGSAAVAIEPTGQTSTLIDSRIRGATSMSDLRFMVESPSRIDDEDRRGGVCARSFESHG